MDSVIIGEFSNQNPVMPVILSLVHKEVDELLNLLVDTLSLAVCLRVVGCGGHDFNSEYLLRPYMKFDMNWGPLSLITSSGSPCNFQTLSQNSRVTPSEVMSDVVGMKWAHLDSRFTASSMES